MKRLLMTTMLLLPIGGGVAFSQETTADEVGDAAGDAVETTEQGIEEGAEAAGNAIEGATDEVQTETPEPEADAPTDEAEVEVVETGQTDEAEAEVEVVDTEQTDKAGAEVEAETEQAVAEPVVREQAPNELRVDWITGTEVTSPEGEAIGDINDLILDGETGEMSAAVLSVGGFLGIGAKQIAVDWFELQIDHDANEISLNMTREEADAAPEYVFRDQEQPPAPRPADTGTGGVGTDAGGGMGTGTAEDPGVEGTIGTGGAQEN